MEISIDTLGGTSFESMGVSEFLSVPYSYYSDVSGRVSIDTLSSGYSLIYTTSVTLTMTDLIVETMVNPWIISLAYDSGGAIVGRASGQCSAVSPIQAQ